MWFKMRINDEASGEDSFGHAAATDPEEANPHREELNDLIVDARLSMIWREYALAAEMWRRAWVLAGESAAIILRAEILEGIESSQKRIVECNDQLSVLINQVRKDPENACGHFRLALILSSLGNREGAMKEYRSALESPEGLCGECFRDLWNNIGWQHFRMGNLFEARRWFDLAYLVAGSEDAAGKLECKRILENRMLVFSELGLEQEAAEAIRDYFRRGYGRVPWPQRRATTKLGLDPDEEYLKCHSQGIS